MQSGHAAAADGNAGERRRPCREGTDERPRRSGRGDLQELTARRARQPVGLNLGQRASGRLLLGEVATELLESVENRRPRHVARMAPKDT